MAKRILVVDDEESIRFTFESFLSEQGFLVDCVENYDEAVAKFQEIDFDLIFADIPIGPVGVKPGMNDQRAPFIENR